MGSGTRLAPVPAKKAPQSIFAPAAWALAIAVEGRVASGRPSRRVGTKAAASSASQALVGHRAEHRVGAELQVGGGALLGEGPNRVGEAHRLAHVAHPVGGVGGLLGVEQLSRQVGDDRDLGLVVG